MAGALHLIKESESVGSLSPKMLNYLSDAACERLQREILEY